MLVAGLPRRRLLVERRQGAERFILDFAMSDSTETVAAETAKPATELISLNIQEIMKLIPHRYPFLLIDRILEMERKVRLVAIKNVTANEPQFTGHFPDYPLMPGVLTIEAMAQAGAVLLLSEIEDRENKLVVFTGIDEAKFRRPVTPGDQMRIEVETIQWSNRMSKMKGTCTVNGKVAASAIITCQITPRVRKAAEAAGE
jgi:3-hydroxyacyl-[acyl-carrier-protein] dehydratase